MANLKDIHHIVIGYDRVKEYVINREILRYNFPNGLDVWLTTVYNGDLEKLASGCGENTFITIPENTGYAYGALDAINAGLNFASASYRDIVVLTNFDGFFFNQERYDSSHRCIVIRQQCKRPWYHNSLFLNQCYLLWTNSKKNPLFSEPKQ